MSDTSIAIALRDLLVAAAPVAVTVGNAVDHIDAIAHHILFDEKRDAYEAMHVIATMVDTLRGLLDGKIGTSDTEAELLVLRKSILEAPDPLPAQAPSVDDRFDPGGK